MKTLVLEPNKSIIVVYHNFIISVRGGHFDYSLLAQKNLATPLGIQFDV